MIDETLETQTQKIIFVILVVTTIGLITIPLFPWVSCETKSLNVKTGEKVTVTLYDSQEEIHLAAESDSSKEIENLDNDINIITISFWLALIFAILAFIGLQLAKGSRLSSTVGYIILLIASGLLVWGILTVLYHGFFISEVFNLQKTIGGTTFGAATVKISFSYNYVPIVMSIVLLIASIIYVATVVPYSIKSLRALYHPRALESQEQLP